MPHQELFEALDGMFKKRLHTAIYVGYRGPHKTTAISLPDGTHVKCAMGADGDALWYELEVTIAGAPGKTIHVDREPSYSVSTQDQALVRRILESTR